MAITTKRTVLWVMTTRSLADVLRTFRGNPLPHFAVQNNSFSLKREIL